MPRQEVNYWEENLFMNSLTYIKMALNEAGKNRLRSFLTVLGIVIGIGSLICVMSLGKAGGEKISSELNKFGINRVLIYGESGSKPLEIDDAEFLYEQLSDKALICPQAILKAKIEYKGSSTACEISGTYPELFEIEYKELSAGRFINENDMTYSANNIVLSYEACEHLFADAEEAIGKSVYVGNKKFQVIGVEKKTKPLFDSIFTVKCYVPYSSFEDYSGTSSLSEISVSAIDGERLSEIADRATELLSDSHGSELKMINMSEQADNAREIIATFELIISAIAVISLIVGGIGIMNIMIVTVGERTREIGIRKAIGATDMSILLQFLAEAAVYSLLGAVFGVIFGVMLTSALSYIIGIETSLLYESVIISVLVSLFIGLAFGVIPAYRASKLNTVDAIRQN